jgi:indolepyruvate ferredoxin oxidoreductase
MTTRLLGSTATLNVFLLGYGWQLGGIPVSLEALERAIELNGVAVSDNLKAFHFGRVAAMDPAKLNLSGETRAAAGEFARTADLESLIAQRKTHLTGYQNPRLAGRFESLVRRVMAKEAEIAGESTRLARAVALGYAKVLAYKDEYEVARLYTQNQWRERLAAQFEPGYRLEYLLAPPLLGTRKRRFGGWMGGMFALLARGKFLRGTRLDPFGYLAERKTERWMIGHFESVVEELLGNLGAQNLGIAARIVNLADSVRGFGHVKDAAIKTWLETEGVLLREFRGPATAAVPVFDPKRSDRDAA